MFALASLLLAPAQAALPADVEAAKADVIAIASANLDRWGDPTIQAQLEPHVEVLADWFADNRPTNEVDLTVGSWRAIWYEDASLTTLPFLPFLETDVNNSYQVVRDGFYYNAGQYTVDLGFFSFTASTFLKGNYTIGNPASPANAGERAVNVIELEFADNLIRLRGLPTFLPLTTAIDLLDRGVVPGGIPVPGPAGVTGDLYNLFVDDDLRVAFGDNDTGSDTGNGLYVLVRQDFATR